MLLIKETEARVGLRARCACPPRPPCLPHPPPGVAGEAQRSAVCCPESHSSVVRQLEETPNSRSFLEFRMPKKLQFEKHSLHFCQFLSNHGREIVRDLLKITLTHLPQHPSTPPPTHHLHNHFYIHPFTHSIKIYFTPLCQAPWYVPGMKNDQDMIQSVSS